MRGTPSFQISVQADLFHAGHAKSVSPKTRGRGLSKSLKKLRLESRLQASGLGARSKQGPGAHDLTYHLEYSSEILVCWTLLDYGQ